MLQKDSTLLKTKIIIQWFKWKAQETDLTSQLTFVSILHDESWTDQKVSAFWNGQEPSLA